MDYISQPCYVDEVNMLPLGQTPRATRVSTVQGGRSVEVATKAGPFAAMDRTNLSYCYSHTAEGAITAGANFLLHSTWDAERRDSIAMELADNSDGTLAGKVFDSSRSHSGVYSMQDAHITGYYYEIRDENNVLVVYTFTLGDDPKTLTIPLRMTWVKDWKVIYPETPDAWGIGELTDEAKTRHHPVERELAWGSSKSLSNEVTKSLGEIILNLGTWWVKAPVPSLFVTSSPAYKLQDYLRFLLAAVMITSLICAGIKVIIDGRGDSLRQVAQSLITVVVISGAGLALASTLISIFDETSIWLLNTVTEESAETFGKRIIPILWESTQVPGGTVPVLLLALAGILANVVQMAMIWIRSVLLMVIMGLAPDHRFNN